MYQEELHVIISSRQKLITLKYEHDERTKYLTQAILNLNAKLKVTSHDLETELHRSSTIEGNRRSDIIRIEQL